MSRFAHAHTPFSTRPPSVLAEVDAAWERAQDLVAGELELHFAASVGGRVRGELRAVEGEVSSGCPPPRRWRSPAATRRSRSPRRCRGAAGRLCPYAIAYRRN